MESPVVTSESRARKRRRKDIENVTVDKSKSVERKGRNAGKALVGRYVKKEFDGNGIFLGRIVSYYNGLYRVDYEDGDFEDLDLKEVNEYLVLDSDLAGAWASKKKKKLDRLLAKKGIEFLDDITKNTKNAKDTNAVDNLIETVVRFDKPEQSELRSNLSGEIDEVVMVNGDVDLSSDSSEIAEECSGLEIEVPVPPPELPSSSGNINVPEESVSHLFSVYSFLRSFSTRLFLNPFGLDEFVGSLNCAVPNTLLDGIHVALMRLLKRHLETLSTDEHALKCLRSIDWSLLDTLTWPVLLLAYLLSMGHIKGIEWKGFCADALGREYYALSAATKLMILQILCEDVLESDELRAEIDMREESEVGLDPNTITTIAPENGPKRVHPRYSKTSACKDTEALEIIAEVNETKSTSNTSSLGCNGGELAAVDADNADANSDDCRLCGMDGNLLCCDGCPSAYHHRCIGVNKLSIPEGLWFCPECTINKTLPTTIKGTSLSGAEIFGVDSYGQVFLGTCSHLLVLKVSFNREEPCLRYYNRNDSLKVMQSLYLSEQHKALYSDICKAILEFWDITDNAFSLSDSVKTAIVSETHEVIERSEVNNTASAVIEVNADHNIAIPCLESSQDRPGSHETPLDVNVEGTLSTGLGSSQSDQSDLRYGSGHEKALGKCLVEASESEEGHNGVHGTRNIDFSYDCSYMGSCFKPHSYTNNYVHGDYAASAAANLALLSSEDNTVSEAQSLSNPRKVMTAKIALQMKAFSMAATRFYWPSSEKKLVEIPRERCGWCLACQEMVSSKRGCFLNLAASNAIKAATQILDRVNPVKGGEGSLPSISTYMICMEECLHGLIAGPFLSPNYRKQWRKEVEQASTCGALRGLLLELEENIRAIGLTGDWLKLVDHSVVETSVAETAITNVVSNQKRGPAGRRNRKHNGSSEITAKNHVKASDFVWWRGGKMLTIIFQRGLLPLSVLRKAARQGGSKKVSGVDYTEDPQIPRRTRQFIWRAAVEMTQTASQLALQVRCLDSHVRWGDLVRPEQTSQDGKATETDALAFRNGIICDKKIVDGKVRYGVSFRNQKHLPSRVMKNNIEFERTHDGKDKYWFGETHIPLYLIKEYEAMVGKAALTSANKSLNVFSKLQKRQLKAARKDIFSYLNRRRDNLEKCFCASCQVDVLLRSAVKCSGCQGYCHEDCTIRSAVHRNAGVESLITCKQCHQARSLVSREICRGSPTSPLPVQSQEFPNSVAASKIGRQKVANQGLTPVRAAESRSKMKATTSSGGSNTAKKRVRDKHCSWGIIWEKKNINNNGVDFRLKNFLLKGNPEIHSLQPNCVLCHQPYDPELMYVRCETCTNWYHTDALELDESQFMRVVGFKCCKCRRIKSPLCPYMRPEDQRQEVKRQQSRRQRASVDPTERKQESSRRSQRNRSSVNRYKETSSIPMPVSPWSNESEPTTPLFLSNEEPSTPLFISNDDMYGQDDMFVDDDDPLLYSFPKVDQFADEDPSSDFDWNPPAPSTAPQKLQVRPADDFESSKPFESGPQKLEVKRSTDDFYENNPCNAELSKPVESGGPQKLPVRRGGVKHETDDDELSEPIQRPIKDELPQVEWEFSTNGFADEMMFDCDDLNYEDLEFEPQTYFNLTELLPSETSGGQLADVGPPGFLFGNRENSSNVNLQVGVSEPLKPVPAANMVPNGGGVCSNTKPTTHDLACSNRENPSSSNLQDGSSESLKPEAAVDSLPASDLVFGNQENPSSAKLQDGISGSLKPEAAADLLPASDLVFGNQENRPSANLQDRVCEREPLKSEPAVDLLPTPDLVFGNQENPSSASLQDGICEPEKPVPAVDLTPTPDLVFGNRENPSSATLQDRIHESMKPEPDVKFGPTPDIVFGNQENPPSEVVMDTTVCCRMCSDTEVTPDLSCICGLWMHSKCSPWDEQPSWEGSWRCGYCRERGQ